MSRSAPLILPALPVRGPPRRASPVPIESMRRQLHLPLFCVSHHHSDADLASTDVPPFTPAAHSGNYFALLMQLDDLAEPGIPGHVFRSLFGKCQSCDMHMTSRTTLFHDCKGPEIEVIDLTNED